MGSNSNLPKLLSALILLTAVLETTSQDCPYPCYPPPIGPGDNPTPITTPPLPTTPPAFFSPPVSPAPPAWFSPPSPTYFFGGAPPPPNTVVPWWPYFSRNPPHLDYSSSPLLIGPTKTVVVAVFSLLVCFLGLQ
ncbi:hydroxyproline-rich glycoprotein family protein [Striga hermonthica]|uniref:Hydroxyproline-rich glycoprotein family protein n=1 Tax=Striga hermonthica TaxID=68872 RepID=A0A9N7REJ1_STRHE|nr:hydroxyproline-rich glycoprotein family protein [Striga hermonthica]